ncbi:MAG: PIN domain-containing protein [Pseudolysinimonas sp.]
MAIYAATLDACVLVPVSLADILLRLAEKQLFRPVWSERILDEVRRTLRIVHPDLDPAAIERRIWHMTETFPGAVVGNHDHLEAGLELPDPADRHVLAAALRGHCHAIVTANVRDFPNAYLATMDIEAVTTDQFLLNQLDLAPRQVLDSIREMAAATRRPARSTDELLEILGRAGVAGFADEVAQRLD